MSFWEVLMLVCFGAAWPISIWKSLRTRTTAGKSVVFLSVILVGYLAGMLHKALFRFDAVFYLYLLNFSMVAVDLYLYFRNRRAPLPAPPQDSRNRRPARI